MFKKDNRYVTREVNEEVDIRLQLMIWSMLDKLIFFITIITLWKISL